MAKSTKITDLKEGDLFIDYNDISKISSVEPYEQYLKGKDVFLSLSTQKEVTIGFKYSYVIGYILL